MYLPPILVPSLDLCLGQVECVSHVTAVSNAEVLLTAEFALQVGELRMREGGAAAAWLAVLVGCVSIVLKRQLGVLQQQGQGVLQPRVGLVLALILQFRAVGLVQPCNQLTFVKLSCPMLED